YGSHRSGLDRFTGQEAMQIFGQGQGRGVALPRFLLQTLQANGHDVVGQVRLQMAWGERVARLHLEEGLQRRLGYERRPTGAQFVQDGPERVDVRGRADLLRLAGRLLRGDIVGRAQDRAALRLNPAANQELGQPEVGDLGHAVRRQEDVRRSQIAVDNATL